MAFPQLGISEFYTDAAHPTESRIQKPRELGHSSVLLENSPQRSAPHLGLDQLKSRRRRNGEESTGKWPAVPGIQVRPMPRPDRSVRGALPRPLERWFQRPCWTVLDVGPIQHLRGVVNFTSQGSNYMFSSSLLFGVVDRR